MIGRIAWKSESGRSYTFELSDDGRWSCPEESAWADFLDAKFPADDYSPAAGRFGFRQLGLAGDHFHAEPEYLVRQDEFPGRVH